MFAVLRIFFENKIKENRKLKKQQVVFNILYIYFFKRYQLKKI